MNPAVNDAQTFELARLQTMDALRSVAEGMRHAATVLDNFAGAVSRMHHGQGIPPLPQGYALSSPVLPQGGGPPRQVEEHAQPQKRKRQTKVKDPNAPKRPASSYLLFQNAVRQEIKKENPSLPNNELLALISQRWAGMSEKEKQIYDDAMKASKVRYAAEKAAYEAASKPANGVAPSPLTVRLGLALCSVVLVPR
ncbi:HMG-box [Punctularia strigosozonata HHB-11173 SS5]|uniref:HMG-box n=1 Tax=Punctularia strigosozonata (strain HHB-11173) TaxID=741275 RepID=UPI0004416272|nr:HMG-box [Punctularia strigosozonata HHB-11173 SS5]EIN10173.1 HMG-box [Punctularia strigosozonata HHB-11173 SS5]